eukprot:6334555-Amphidinium_carterae.1
MRRARCHPVGMPYACVHLALTLRIAMDFKLKTDTVDGAAALCVDVYRPIAQTTIELVVPL